MSAIAAAARKTCLDGALPFVNEWCKARPSLADAWAQFSRRVPLGTSSTVVVEDALAYLTHNIQRDFSGCLKYLERPTFVDHMAAFGALPNHAFILSFDPYASQRRCVKLHAKDDDDHDEVDPHEARLKIRSATVAQMFGNPQASMQRQTVCRLCKSSQYMTNFSIQTRRSDEMAHDGYRCAKCETGVIQRSA